MAIIRHCYISPGHRFYGRHGLEPENYSMIEVDSVECVAGRGIRGDRFFDYKPDYKGQITFFSWEILQQMWEDLAIDSSLREASATRRNIILERVHLDEWIGEEFIFQGIRFLGMEECKPCYWMNGAIHPEAEEWMKGRGGLRAKILSDGVLRREKS